MPKRKNPNAGGGYGGKRRKGSPWGDPAAGWRKTAMSSFMKNLWQTYPRKKSYWTPEVLSARNEAGPQQISGIGDYYFSKRRKSSLGARAGAWLGDKAQAFLGRITGLGDYSVRQNSLVNDPPSVRNNSARTVTLSHREYLCDIVTGEAGSFKLQNWEINPGNPTTFPWLSGVAKQFQQYRLDGMLFQFKSMSANALNSTNTALGQVIMATNYNTAQPLFDSKYEMENTEFSTSIKPSESAMHPIECARNESTLNELYVAPGGAIPEGQSEQFYNFANFQLATNGFQAANVNIGELWVTYEVTLLKPILNSINQSESFWAAHYTRPEQVYGAGGPSGPWSVGPTNTVGDLWRPSSDKPGSDNLELTFSGTNGVDMTIAPSGGGYFPVGTQLLILVCWQLLEEVTAPGGSISGAPGITNGSLTEAFFQENAAAVWSEPANVADPAPSTLMLAVVVKTTSATANPIVSFTSVTPPTTSVGTKAPRVDITISQMPEDFYTA